VKILILSSLLFLSGCSTFDIITSSLNVLDLSIEKKSVIVKTPKKIKKPKDWNPPIIIPKETKLETPIKEERNFPWWALILAIVSGTSYLINSRKR
jgi:hypothetical protein